jgi:hypothetical protein
MRRRHRLPTRLRGDDLRIDARMAGRNPTPHKLVGPKAWRSRKPASRPASWLSLIRELGRAKAEQRRQSGSYRIVKSHQYTPDCEPRVPPLSAHTSSRFRSTTCFALTCFAHGIYLSMSAGVFQLAKNGISSSETEYSVTRCSLSSHRTKSCNRSCRSAIWLIARRSALFG